jgi:hypothetical protein
VKILIPKDDWRRTGQENYLIGMKLLYISKYKPFSERWEHEHCCFCNQKISQCEGDNHSGYCTNDKKQTHWICEECYEDFKDEFNWILIK